MECFTYVLCVRPVRVLLLSLLLVIGPIWHYMPTARSIFLCDTNTLTYSLTYLLTLNMPSVLSLDQKLFCSIVGFRVQYSFNEFRSYSKCFISHSSIAEYS